MNILQRIGSYFLLGALGFLFQSVPAFPQTAAPAPTEAKQLHDGQHDFDWQLGTWKIHMSRLQHPLTGSTTWTDLDGTVAVRKVWDGRANLAEIVADGLSGQLEFLSMRLYDPASSQWSLNFASSNGGTLSMPMIGEFKNGRGEFYDQESFNGSTLLVRFVFSDISATSGRDEQAFSDDGGKSWEVNWIADDTLSTGASGTAPASGKTRRTQ